MITGIPYFGIDNQEVYETILDSKVNNEISYSSLYDLVNNNIDNKIIVVIDNKWLTWLNDIKFNYRDKQCSIPYYTYELYAVDRYNFKGNNKGHLITDEDTVYIRFNYNYLEKELNLDNLSSDGLVLYNLETKQKILAKTNKWFSETQFNIDKLYKLYLNSCFTEDDFLVNSHLGGYHYISRAPKQFKNKEKDFRADYDLDSYSEETVKNFDKYFKDYRDVRNYTYDELVTKFGFVENTEIYKIRRLKFESYLFCILRSNVESNNNEFNNKFKGLGKRYHIVKYGDTIKLIFKDYWLKEFKPLNQKTWSRI